MSRAKVTHHLSQKFGVMRFHFKRRNQVADLVDLGHCFAMFRRPRGGPLAKISADGHKFLLCGAKYLSGQASRVRLPTTDQAAAGETGNIRDVIGRMSAFGGKTDMTIALRNVCF